MEWNGSDDFFVYNQALLFRFLLGWFQRFLTFWSWFGYVYTIPDSFSCRHEKKKSISAEQNRTTTEQRHKSQGFQREQVAGELNSPPIFTWTRRLLFFGNYPDLKRALMCFHWIKEPKFNEVCVLFKQSNFCSRIPEMHSKMPRFQTFPRNSRFCREFFSFSTYSKAFAT